VTVGRLAARFALSRTTLLYYDRLGLLHPQRSSAGYRRYGPRDVARLAAICRLRAAGLPLELIGRLLSSGTPDLVEALAVRLTALDEEIDALRGQQRVILTALASGEGAGRTWAPDRATLVALLDRAGPAGDHLAWHAAAERADGRLHQLLLEALDLTDDEIAALRSHVRDLG
jgi:DNA-binding transcriptional MerR regulator